MAKGWYINILDRGFCSNLIAEYPASITGNKCHIVWVKCISMLIYLQVENVSVFTIGHVVNFMWTT